MRRAVASGYLASLCSEYREAEDDLGTGDPSVEKAEKGVDWKIKGICKWAERCASKLEHLLVMG
jgi:hypothetical protein